MVLQPDAAQILPVGAGQGTGEQVLVGGKHSTAYSWETLVCATEMIIDYNEGSFISNNQKLIVLFSPLIQV